ncbi:hypothetical protein N7508_007951 [Penicillium antarcticum]|uniref:uncharacterized protein n=1 Tax=Penicillium antarcticum TaxID=416450 RepID=UPI0023A339A3|nr:uncharacterized protein N7508_007951 [Penicillium antarcticum]KAJ5297702.1 hypothetical protein N7508_007951 [Penicillium antarcticum]
MDYFPVWKQRPLAISRLRNHITEYPKIIERVKAGDILLDAGCAFVYALRQLAVDGAPAANLICTKDFSIWDMNSFESMERFEACFIAGDLSNPDTVLSGIAGKVDIVHAAAIFHLCVWDDQVKVGVQFSVLFRPDANATVVDRQIADLEPLDPVDQAIQDLCWYRHNMRTWQQLK